MFKKKEPIEVGLSWDFLLLLMASIRITQEYLVARLAGVEGL